MDSILTSVKLQLGISPAETCFDETLIMNINSVFAILQQLGVGPSGGYTIQSAENTWNEFLAVADQIEMVKSYMYLKVKVLFDPSASSVVMDACNRMISEFEWRLFVSADSDKIGT